MDIQELRVTAELAHIKMSEAELAQAFGAFEQMLLFFQAMQAADGEAALPAALDARAVDAAAFRQDAEGNEGDAWDAGGGLVERAGATDGRFVVIPNVL
ncbi:MAG: aspartyl/glutamyl-tRNA amidotransferase subunit C [Spirochaetaceae bacterium]|jgi:aspartyl-tRNA(Asn)/glutamyl-tRNA(Gln) amidotransferase subunit C|nr:aspartyl/glutamyl-tRNA amidotransferase subunit C [Spirochaetaceae bacterium]